MLGDCACTSAVSGSATNTVAAGRGRRITRPLCSSIVIVPSVAIVSATSGPAL
jgi:hypothetical protein